MAARNRDKWRKLAFNFEARADATNAAAKAAESARDDAVRRLGVCAAGRRDQALAYACTARLIVECMIALTVSVRLMHFVHGIPYSQKPPMLIVRFTLYRLTSAVRLLHRTLLW